MTVEELINLLNSVPGKKLTFLQEQILRYAWEGFTYAAMAKLLHYQDTYIKNIASQLWQELSELVGEPITKSNFRIKLKFYFQQAQPEKPATSHQIETLSLVNMLEFPSGPVPLYSKLYIERPPIETLTYQEIHQPGSVISLKAPSKMGKSSLLCRVLQHATQSGYATAYIDFLTTDTKNFESLEQLLRWLCVNISHQVCHQPVLDESWNEELGSKINCTLYLEEQILSKLDCPLVIGFNEVNCLFEFPSVAQDFLALLRFWHEKAKQTPIWQKLRLIVAHSTACYVPLNLHESPLNVGLPLELPLFTAQQVQELALRHGLSWQDEEGINKAESLWQLVGGHPYLVRLALYYLCRSQLTLDQLLEEAATQTGIYRSHLLNHLAVLQDYPELAMAFKGVVDNPNQVILEAITAHKLESMGLIKLEGSRAMPSCQLYRQYFRQQLTKLVPVSHGEFEGVNLSNFPEVRGSSSNGNQSISEQFDSVTRLVNREGFDETLDREWRRLARKATPLSLLLCQVDHDSEHCSGEGCCLQRVAQILRQCIHRPCDLGACIEDKEFAILLPETDASGALTVAENFRRSVKALGIAPVNGSNSRLEHRITISLGVACTIPQPDSLSHALIEEADRALHKARVSGGDRVVLSATLNVNF